MTASPPAAEQYAKKSAAPGLPSEDEIYAALKPWTVTFRSEHRRRTARAILSLIRPAFEAKELEIRKLCMQALADEGQYQENYEARLSAEAKLAQAVEDEREACAKVAEDKMHTLDFRARAAIAAAIRARSASAAARGETTTLASGKETP
jgi:hypothetical protein